MRMGSEDTGSSGAGAGTVDSVYWWDQHFRAYGESGGVPYAKVFFPVLVTACERHLPASELSIDEISTLVKFCLATRAWQDGIVTKKDCLYFLARFGPLELAISKVIECFCANRELVPWFHGTLTRTEAEQVLSSKQLADGAFLIRFSESHPSKFTLTYMKIHPPTSPLAGKRELKNCLIENAGQRGYALTDSSARAYPSIASFIQRSASRLKYGIASLLAQRCNQELASIRMLHDLQSNDYTTFSAEAFELPEAISASNKAMLFANSPVMQPRIAAGTSCSNQYENDSNDCCSDSYSGFSLDTLTPPKSFKIQLNANACSSTATKKPFGEISTGPDNDYGCFAYLDGATEKSNDSNNDPQQKVFKHMVMTPAQSHLQPTANTDYGNFASFNQLDDQDANCQLPPAIPLSKNDSKNQNEYATFQALATTFAGETRQLAQRNRYTFSLSSTPPRSPAHNNHDSDTYGSFTSLSVVKPSAYQQNTQQSVTESSSEYGTFASFAQGNFTDQLWDQNESSRPVVESAMEMKTSLASSASDVYGTFAISSSDPSLLRLPSQSSPSPQQSEMEKALENEAAPSGIITTTLSEMSLTTISSSDSRTSTTTDDANSGVSALFELNAGMELYKQKQFEDAIVRFVHAQDLAIATNDQVVEARALGNLGTVYLDNNMPQQAVKCYQRCLEITRSIKDTKRERTILNNLVLALTAAEEFERALEYCEVQLEMTTNDINRRKIFSRMSLLRERATRAARAASNRS